MRAVLDTAEERGCSSWHQYAPLSLSLVKTNSLYADCIIMLYHGGGRVKSSTSAYLISPPVFSILTPWLSKVLHLFLLSVNILFADTFISHIIVGI